MNKPQDETKTAYAGFWLRTVASLIDSLLIVLLMVPLMLPLYGADMTLDKVGLVQGELHFLVSWLLPAAIILLFWFAKAATPGKMLFSARIVDAKTGDKPTLPQFLARYLAYTVAIIPFGLGLLWVALDPRKQGWHDKIAGTVVVRDPR